jgi:hypothetical protein
VSDDKTEGSLPAFPIDSKINRWGDEMSGCVGLTKREYFAAMAMAGMLAPHLGMNEGRTAPEYAVQAVKCADALIEALNAKEIAP